MIMQATDIDNTIIGYVVDSSSNEPLPFVTVKIAPENGKSMFFASDENGKFTANTKTQGKHLVAFSCLGYEADSLWTSVSKQITNLGTIKLKPRAKELQGIEIVERRKLIKLTSSGIEYDLANDLKAKSDNLLDALNYVPLVNVDGKGDIQVGGSSSYTIYLNGKPYRIAQQNPKDVLQSIPASTISKIEVITNLDAGYDGDSRGAVINIITAKKTLDGYYVSLNAGGETQPKASAGISFLMTKNKVNASIGYNYSVDSHYDQPVDTKHTIFDKDGIASEQTLESIGDGTWKNHTIRTLFEFNIDSVQSLYIDAHALLKGTQNSGMATEIYSVPASGSLHSYYVFNNDFWQGSAESNIIYRKLFKQNKKDLFTIGYRFTYNPDKRETEQERHIYNGVPEDNIIEFSEKDRYVTDGGLYEHTLQSDYVIPLKKAGTICIGAKDILRHGNTHPKYSIWDYTADKWTDNDPAIIDSHGNMKQLQNIGSAYLNYSLSTGKFNISAGLRGEHTHNKISFKEVSQYDFTRNIFDIIPRVNVSFMTGKSAQFSLSYSSTVVRPSIWEMNPFRNKMNAYYVSFGNPNLVSERNHDINLNFMSFSNKLFLSAGMKFNHTNNAIMRFSVMDEVNPSITNLTYGNIGERTNVGANIYVNYRPINALSFTLYGDMGNCNIKSRQLETDNNYLTYNFNFRGEVTMKHNWCAGMSVGHYKSAPTQVHTTVNSLTMYSLYVKKYFLKRKLCVTLTANDFFDKYMKSTRTTINKDFHFVQNNYITSRSFGVALSYNFGSGEKTKLKRNNSITNDDLKTKTGVK